MNFSTGLTTWVVQIGRTVLIWRWNMPMREAMRTLQMKTSGNRGRVAAGPLIVEWV